MGERITDYLTLMRLSRPIGIYLLLWPTLWALWFAADGFPNQRILLIFIAGVVLMRSAGCVINDYFDRKIDPLVARTKNRPIASGRVSPTEAIALFIVLSVLAFLLVLQTNKLTVYMAVVAMFLAISYPIAKRIHSLPQVHLGLAFGWAIPMAYTAQTNALPPLEGWLLYAAGICWSVAYDTMYAMADRDDDKADRCEIFGFVVWQVRSSAHCRISVVNACVLVYRWSSDDSRKFLLRRLGRSNNFFHISTVSSQKQISRIVFASI